MTNIRQEPFVLSAAANRLSGHILIAATFSDIINRLEERELPGFLRAYIEEGIPTAFAERPMLWEAIRAWLANALGVRADHMSVVGSARLGFSPRPSKFGTAFGPASDLDLTVVDEKLFECLDRDSRMFISLDNDRIDPNASAKKAELWEENRAFCRRNSPRGFLDANKIPSLDKLFPTASDLNDKASIIKSRLDVSQFPIRTASFRVYSRWADFERQVLLNYRDIAIKLKEAKSK